MGHAWTERKKMFLKGPTGIRDLCEVSEDQLTVGEETTLLQFGDGKSGFATGNLCSCALFHPFIDPSAEIGCERFQIASR